jgi:ligand-binding sensor domain-containing protein
MFRLRSLLSTPRRRLTFGVVFVTVAFSITVWLAMRYLDQQRAALADADRVLFEVETLTAPDVRGITHWLARAAAADIEPFGGLFYVASASGLECYDHNGRLVRRYTTLDGLPENTLTSLDQYEGRLYIGTIASGLLAFDGEQFTRYRITRPTVGRITVVRAAPDTLLVGTSQAGLLEFDGTTFTRRYQTAAGAECRQVTALLPVGPRVYIGTHDAGLFEWREGSVRHYATADGLPSPRVVGLAMVGYKLVVATDLGTVALEGERLDVVDTTPNVSGVGVVGDELWLASLTAGIRTARAGPISAGQEPVRLGTLPVDAATGLEVEDGRLWVFTKAGLYVCTSPHVAVRFERFDDGMLPEAPLSEGHVAALAFDGRGRLWAGTFDGGVDIIDPANGRRVEHLSDDAVHDVNALLPDPASDRMYVGAATGLAIYDSGRPTRVVTERDGMVGENVAGLAFVDTTRGREVVAATNRGVTFFDGVVARSITAFNGLPNNHVYSVAGAPTGCYAGTLGGLARIESLRVTHTYATAGSRLPHNWVNALAYLDGRLFIGTYGGGVAMLLPSGEILPAEQTAGESINPNAMHVDGSRLYAGTLGGGLIVYDSESGGWTRLLAGLTSTSVTAIATDASYVYIGTEHGITRVEHSLFK